jgi:hypothetical protein
MRTRALLGALLLAATVLALAPQAQAASACPPIPPAGSTVAGNITVAGGTFCLLQNVTVTGNVKVSPGAELIMEGGQVKGTVHATDAWVWLGAFRTLATVKGAVTFEAPRDWRNCGTSIDGNFTVSHWTAVIPPPVAFPPCALAPGFVAPIGGNLSFLDNTVAIFYTFTSIKGTFNATGNTGGTYDNLSIGGSATCSNTPPATFTNSTVHGTNTCPG